MQPGKLKRRIITASLCAAISITAFGLGQAPQASAAASYGTKVTTGVNLRTEPSLSGDRIQMLKQGETIQVISKVNAYWLKVKTQQGLTGYISADAEYTNYSGSTTSVSSSSKADRVIELAMSYRGRISYDFGTRNQDRLIFDCSSFTQFIYGKAGVDLKWGTKDQKRQGSAVSKKNLRKGDLVFFDTNNNGSINHVGIYMGSGKFIHNAPSADGLAINEINTGWWSKHYVSARRVL
ncbi:hypothetical protein DNH61_06205 [Paenibacillus sambharensis]|uniref:Uncharacterized protein n=1 Tax=Paenibacillus sambharensis TaxID=1803190 RepID=A0A2W1LCB3_9BACL|nr:SH3 domain-containing C40 family peptidase [Paenibacillus sambharensis]PZD96786.1 hypothetical protein DNH61_06205 [Paenibacillus sambharensis]